MEAVLHRPQRGETAGLWKDRRVSGIAPQKHTAIGGIGIGNRQSRDQPMQWLNDDREVMRVTEKQNPPARRIVMIEKGFFYSFNTGNKPRALARRLDWTVSAHQKQD
jgi:hypothetical protein